MSIQSIIFTNFWKIICLIMLLYIVRMRRTGKKKSAESPERGQYGLNIIVNKDYNMTKGKVISQVCHGMSHVMCHMFKNQGLLDEWKRCGEPKVVLKGSSDEINEVVALAKKNGIYFHRICDAGRTQVPPGANTVVVIGPALRSKLETVSGSLKLY